MKSLSLLVGIFFISSLPAEVAKIRNSAPSALPQIQLSVNDTFMIQQSLKEKGKSGSARLISLNLACEKSKNKKTYVCKTVNLESAE